MINRPCQPSSTPLPLYFMSLSKRHVQENVNRPSGFHNVLQLLFVLDGEGFLECGGTVYPLKRGCAFYHASDVPHRYWSDGSLITAWITCRGSGCKEIIQYIENRSFLFCSNVEIKKYVSMIETLEREYFDKKREGYLSAMTYSLLLSFFEDQSTSTVSDMDRVLHYMEAHYDQKITIEQLAELAHMSKSTFCKKFKQQFGCTAFEKLIDIRLLSASTMLRHDPGFKIGFVAKKCGFEDVSYFCKLYKKKFSVTPSEER